MLYSFNLPLILAVIVFALAILYWSIPARWRMPLMLLSSMGMLAAFDPVYAAMAVLQIMLTFAASAALLGSSRVSRTLVVQAILLWLVGCLALTKLRTGAAWHSPAALTLGFSYITFRLIHYVVLAYRRELERASPLELMNYALFFPSLAAGPVMNYKSYAAQRAESGGIDPELLSRAILRILLGLFKKFILSNQLSLAVVAPVFAHPELHSRWVIVAAVCSDLVRIFLDFSGYTDIAIGTARLFGYRLPENFNYPLLKTNIAEFWRSWHITLHEFIRDHVFLPLVAFRPSQAKLYVGLFCTMLLMMLWHAFTLGFLVLGVLQGLALVLWQGLQELKRKNRRLAALVATRPMRVCGNALTFLYCAFSFQFGFKGYDATMALYSWLW